MNKAYVVATAHLDTVWRWNLAKTVEEYIPDTIQKNFDLIEKYPSYKFNFEGAYRYELIEQLYPTAFEQIKSYVKKGNWCISGTSYENGDTNIPSPEAMIRNIIIGDKYFKDKFGQSSDDLFLPDCFGFGWALPSVAHHCGIKGITTQKLSWGSAYGLPFDLGIWKGPDGKGVLTSLNAKSYRHKFSDDVRGDVSVINSIADNSNNADLPWCNHLYGTGDCGGSPTEESVQAVEKSVEKNKDDENFEVISARSDQVFNDIEKLDDAQKAKLPVWENELLMTSHGAGCYTSRAMSKNLNRKCENLAGMAEAACSFASLLGTCDYPSQQLNQAWKRVLAHQFHDDITGTSNMQVYNESWADYSTSIAQFKSEYMNGFRGVISELNTAWVDEKSSAVVVNNPTQYRHKETVEMHIRITRNCKYVRVYDKAGNEIPSQVRMKMGKEFVVLFVADVKPFGFKVYEFRPSNKPCKIRTDLKITNHSIENKKYIVRLNKNGDIGSIFDKELNMEILKSPIKMALLKDGGSLSYPSWEIKKEDIDREPYCYANTPEFKIFDVGPARVSIAVKREAEYSSIHQIISLDSESDIVSVKNSIEWRTRRTMLKAVFPFVASNPKATYDLGLGVIERGNNTDNLYEVPAQKWADITDESGEFGVSILSDSKYGWDKPNDNTLRLTCIHTPCGAFTKETRQDLQDLGMNLFSFGIYSHRRGFDTGTHKQAEFFCSPMVPVVTKDKSKPGSSEHLSFFTVSRENILVRAVKHGENTKDKSISNDVFIRLNEGIGKKRKNVVLKFYKRVAAAKFVNGKEEYICDAPVTDGKVVFDMEPFELKTIQITFEEPNERKENAKFFNVPIPYNERGFTMDYDMRNVILQGSGLSLPFEEIRSKMYIGGIPFQFAFPELQYNVLVCKGQTIKMPQNGATRLYFIAGSALSSQKTVFSIDNAKLDMTINSIKDSFLQWDMEGLDQKYYIHQNLNYGLEFSHTHHPEGNSMQKARFYMYSINIKDKKEIRLPDNSKIVILAMTAAKDLPDTVFGKYFFDLHKADYDSSLIPPVDKIIDKTDSLTIRAGKIEDQVKSGKGKGIKRDNIITNIIRSYTKSEW
ncbi:MAG: hypothetical protein LIO62_08510 [Clostridiales bacterium]|nr:hypothetical protein [Clostridiales bacterium]